MNSVYREILNNFGTDEEIMKAIVANNALIYYLLSGLIIQNSSSYKEIENKEGRLTADHVLSECLIIFRRQVKFRKMEIQVNGKTILIGKNNTDLAEYMTNLLQLVIGTGPLNPSHHHAMEYEQSLVKGQGFQKLYALKEIVEHTLHNCGCKDKQDKEDIFNESLLVLWKKLKEGEAGIYFTETSESMDHCRIYHRKFFQHSKIGTFLTGIARNIFMNLTRNADYAVSRNYTGEITETGSQEPFFEENDNVILMMFLYYRNFIESRKLRTTISILQYDCNLEDKEVQKLVGINNTRIHSCRLRSHFYEWYEQNLSRIPLFLDSSNEYFTKREEKKERMNKKIRTIDQFQKEIISDIDLEIFPEEFTTISEFLTFHLVFKYVYYFISAGRMSALSGLPDESLLRNLMEAYKKELFKLPNYQAILLLLYYGSDEPDESIINLLISLHNELREIDQNAETSPHLVKQLEFFTQQRSIDLTKELFYSNSKLFSNFLHETNFIPMINTHEIAQAAF